MQGESWREGSPIRGVHEGRAYVVVFLLSITLLYKIA